MKRSYLLKPFHIGAAVSALLMAQAVRADQDVTTPGEIPIHVGAGIDAGCANLNNEIVISAEIHHAPCKARVIFKRTRAAGIRRTVKRTYDIDLVQAGSITTNIVVPKNPSDGGVGGNPYVSLVLHDGKGKDLTEEHFLGRCVEGLNISADLIADAMVNTKVRTAGCNNPKGSYLSLEGDIVLSGLHARFIFRNNEKGTHTAEVERDVALIMEGTKIRIPKKIVNNRLGPNPLVILQLLHEDGTAMGAPRVLGRCSRL